MNKHYLCTFGNSTCPAVPRAECLILPVFLHDKEPVRQGLNSRLPKKGNPKECSNYHTIALVSHTSKVMLKILQARLQQYVNCELPGVQAGFRKCRGTRDQIANICWIIENVWGSLGSNKVLWELLSAPLIHL